MRHVLGRPGARRTAVSDRSRAAQAPLTDRSWCRSIRGDTRGTAARDPLRRLHFPAPRGSGNHLGAARARVRARR